MQKLENDDEDLKQWQKGSLKLPYKDTRSNKRLLINKSRQIPWNALKEVGESEGFYLKGDNILFYPTPDSDYTINIDYFLLPYGLNNAEEQIYELKEDDDYINIPERYETLFKNCLISLAMIYAIADDNDENHSGYKRQYENSLKTLIDYCQNGISERNITW